MSDGLRGLFILASLAQSFFPYIWAGRFRQRPILLKPKHQTPAKISYHGFCEIICLSTGSALVTSQRRRIKPESQGQWLCQPQRLSSMLSKEYRPAFGLHDKCKENLRRRFPAGVWTSLWKCSVGCEYRLLADGLLEWGLTRSCLSRFLSWHSSIVGVFVRLPRNCFAIPRGRR